MRLLPFAAAIALGVGLGFVLPLPESDLSATPVSGPAPRKARPPSSAHTNLPEIRAALQNADSASCAAQLAPLVLQLEYDEGRPLEWDDSRPAETQPEAIEKTILEALHAAHPDAELVELDCSEYPCVATAIVAEARGRSELLAPDVPIHDVRILNSGAGTLPDGQLYQVFAIGGDVVPEEATRINLRVEEQLAAVQDWTIE